MMSASKLKPYPEYKDSNVNGLGKIPYHWSVERIGTLGRISKGSGGSKEDNVDSGLPCIRYGDLYTHHNFVVKDFKTHISAESASRYTTLEKGDILFAASGESIDEIGKSVLFNLDETAYCGGDNIICKTGGTDDSDFLGFATNAPYFAAQKSMVGRGFTVLHIYGTQLRDLRLALPPLDERKAISKFISQTKNLLDSQISKLGNLLPLLEEKRSALITQVVTKGLNPDSPMKNSNSQFFGLIPSHWMFTEIKRYCTRITDGSHYSPETQDIGMPYISVKDVDSKGYIDTIGCKKISDIDFEKMVKDGNQPPPNSVLITKDGTIGRAAVVSESNEFVVLSSLGIIEPNPEFLDSHFLRFLLISNPIISSIYSMIEGAALTRITIEKMNRIVAPIPPMLEQREITNFLTEECMKFSESIDNIRKQIKTLKEYRTSLISAAVTGKIDVRRL